jgi:hypothetical protein
LEQTFGAVYTDKPGDPPTHDWRKIKTIEEAEMIARAARDNKDARAVKFAERRARKIENWYHKWSRYRTHKVYPKTTNPRTHKVVPQGRVTM